MIRATPAEIDAYEREALARGESVGGVPTCKDHLQVGKESLTTQRPQKYGAKPTIYNGVRYASKAEAKRAMQLDVGVAAGEWSFWIGQVKFRLGCPENVYVADFLVVGDDGVHVEDVKGMETAKFNRDAKLWARYGPCDLWVIKGTTIHKILRVERTFSEETL